MPLAMKWVLVDAYWLVVSVGGTCVCPWGSGVCSWRFPLSSRRIYSPCWYFSCASLSSTIHPQTTSARTDVAILRWRIRNVERLSIIYLFYGLIVDWHRSNMQRWFYGSVHTEQKWKGTIFFDVWKISFNLFQLFFDLFAFSRCERVLTIVILLRTTFHYFINTCNANHGRYNRVLAQ